MVNLSFYVIPLIMPKKAGYSQADAALRTQPAKRHRQAASPSGIAKWYRQADRRFTKRPNNRTARIRLFWPISGQKNRR
jgi:hypothetical protein